MQRILGIGVTSAGRLLTAGAFVGLGLMGGMALADGDEESGEEIHVCVRTQGASDGFLRLVEGESDCKENESTLSWNKAGEPGAEGPAGPEGAAGPEGPAGPSGTSQAFHATLELNSRITLPNDGQTFIEVLSKDVPAGNYVVNATAWVHDDTFPDTTFAGCILTGGNLFTGHNETIDALGTEDIPMIGVAEFTAPGTLVMSCGGLQGAPTLLQATITAIRVDTIE